MEVKKDLKTMKDEQNLEVPGTFHKSDDLSLILRTHKKVNGENQLHRFSSDIHLHTLVCTPITHGNNNKETLLSYFLMGREREVGQFEHHEEAELER